MTTLSLYFATVPAIQVPAVPVKKLFKSMVPAGRLGVSVGSGRVFVGKLSAEERENHFFFHSFSVSYDLYVIFLSTLRAIPLF